MQTFTLYAALVHVISQGNNKENYLPLVSIFAFSLCTQLIQPQGRLKQLILQTAKSIWNAVHVDMWWGIETMINLPFLHQEFSLVVFLAWGIVIHAVIDIYSFFNFICSDPGSLSFFFLDFLSWFDTSTIGLCFMLQLSPKILIMWVGLFCVSYLALSFTCSSTAVQWSAPISSAGIVQHERLQVDNIYLLWFCQTVTSFLTYSLSHFLLQYDFPFLLSPCSLSAFYICSRTGCCSAVKCAFTFNLL